MQIKIDTKNGVNETRTKDNILPPGRCLMAQQHELGRNTVTAKKLKRPDNRVVMKSYFSKNPSHINFIKTLFGL